MRQIFLAAVFGLFLSGNVLASTGSGQKMTPPCLCSILEQEQRDIQLHRIQKRHHEMLNTTVLIRSKAGAGAGTVVYSDIRNDENDDARQWHTYMITAYHVIQSSITPANNVNGVATPEKYDPVRVTFFEYKNLGANIKQRSHLADIVAYDKKNDLALLRLKEDRVGWKYTARLATPFEYFLVTQHVWIIGSGLGRPPFPIDGVISSIGKVLSNNVGTAHDYILSSAPILMGDSGGGLYWYDAEEVRYKLIGVVQFLGAVAITGGIICAPILHMAFSIHVSAVRAFLADTNYKFILQ